ncbi:MAG: ABC transporter ATP-binding protein [Verrucomicrobiae bacterium]|nr:ABC transporter ATP-binding protein [Verrucomicrobiae bacterium]
MSQSTNTALDEASADTEIRPPVLSISEVAKQYRTTEGTVQAIDHVSLSLEPGDFVALHGPSGCGKSTLLLMAGALLSPDSGTIAISGENPYALGAEARAAFRANRVGFVFQQFHLIPFLDVLDNVLVGELAGTLPHGEFRERARELLDRFQLGHRLHHVPSKLSIGEQQRVALARAFLRSPSLILADEPTGNLDAENAAIILEHLGDFAASGEGAVLMVTHDDRAKAVAGRSVEMRGGRLV